MPKQDLFLYKYLHNFNNFLPSVGKLIGYEAENGAKLHKDTVCIQICDLCCFVSLDVMSLIFFFQVHLPLVLGTN